MTLQEISEAARPHGLFVMGSTETTDATLILLGANAQLWPLFKTSPEYADHQADPLDRWSKRIVGAISERLGADALYPSDGPPYAPFIRWALESGQFFQSPTGMLVHPVAGLMISIRAAIRFEGRITFAQEPAHNPCESCDAKPCTTACPVGSLSADTAYDVPACKAFLDTDDGADCMSNGCKARRACPISQSFARDPEQSAFHMKSFKGSTMLRLILMRHAKSDWGHPGLEDHDRPLNARGRRSALALGRWLKSEGYVPDEVSCSSATRTRATLAGLDLPQSVSLGFHRALYLAEATDMLGTLKQARGECVLMVGHNHGIADMAQRLVSTPPDHPRFFDYPTGATLVVDFNADGWNEIGWHQGQPIAFVIPRELPEV